MKNRNVTFTTILSVVGCFAFLPQVQAVSPPPDGCYPNYTTAEGCNALNLLGAGAGNTGVGWYSLYLVGDGNYNTGVGAGTLVLNTADSNTAVGAAALLLNTTGTENTAVGTDALVYNDSGFYNTGVGAFALFSNTSGFQNVAIGGQALVSNQLGSLNTAVGFRALHDNLAGDNTAVGDDALSNNTMGNENTAIGGGALASNQTGNANTAVGVEALLNNTGTANIAIGIRAGQNLTTGVRNIDIYDQGIAGESDTIRIGAPGFQSATYIAGISGQTASGGIAVFVNSDGKLGTATSSARFKDEIKPMEKASEAILALKPVTFRYKKEIDCKGIPQFGLVAEEVEKVNADLVARDRDGKPYSVRYDAVNAMLLNEFLKEYRKVGEQEAAITELKSLIAQQQKDFQAAIAEQRKEFETRLKEQDAKIQTVNGGFEFSKRAAQIAVENDR